MRQVRFWILAIAVALICLPVGCGGCYVGWMNPNATTTKYVQTKTGLPVTVDNGKVTLPPDRGASIDPAMITQITSLLGGCGGTTSATGIFDANGGFVSFVSGLIPPEPTQADIDFCKPFLSDVQFRTLNIAFGFYHEILTDGVHTLGGPAGGTCPILVWNPKLKAHKAGTLSDADWAKFVYEFFAIAKPKQDLVKKQAQYLAALKVAGLPSPL